MRLSEEKYCSVSQTLTKGVPVQYTWSVSQEPGAGPERTPDGLGIRVGMRVPYETALTLVTDALKTEGFGVITQIDVKDTLKQKLGVDFRKYMILGACNPAIAHRALEASPDVGLLLPCNVTVSETAEGSDVLLVNPIAVLGAVSVPELVTVADEAKTRLERVAQSLRRSK